MNHRVFAMDTYFYNSLGAYEFSARCEMLRALGYDATYLTLWNEAAWKDLALLPRVKPQYGIDVAGVYATLDVAGDETHETNARILRMIESIDGCAHVELAMRTTDKALHWPAPAGTDRAKRLIEGAIKAAEKRGATVSLYPHINFWLDRIEVACALCREFNHPRLRTAFTGFHWYALDGTKLPERLREAGPFLRSVNLCGTRRNAKGSAMPATIEPIGDGELDNFAVLGLLREIGYREAIGFQGFAIGGDAYTFLQRSLTAFREMERRLDAHPTWARLRTE